MDSTSSSWSHLGPDLLSIIADKLSNENVFDFLRLRDVCQSWRSAISRLQPPKNSLIKLPYEYKNHCGHFLLRQSTIYAFEALTDVAGTMQAGETWLVELENSGKAVSSRKYMCGNWLFFKVNSDLNLLDFTVTNICQVYTVEFLVEDVNGVDLPNITKVAVSSSLDEENGTNLTILGLDKTGALFLWRGQDKAWRKISDYPTYYDVVYFKDKFYAVGVLGDGLTVDIGSLKIDRLRFRFDSGYYMNYIARFVKVLDDLYLVACPCPCDRRPRPMICKVDVKKGTLSGESEMEDYALVISSCRSFGVSARTFPGQKYVVWDSNFIERTFPVPPFMIPPQSWLRETYHVFVGWNRRRNSMAS